MGLSASKNPTFAAQSLALFPKMKRISAPQIFQLEADRALLDVRTPAEYAQGHIPGAQNLPLFSDEERAEVGTLYKKVSSERAFLRGLDLAAQKCRGT
jgi:tRNA 2-selenouridine synthase